MKLCILAIVLESSYCHCIVMIFCDVVFTLVARWLTGRASD